METAARPAPAATGGSPAMMTVHKSAKTAAAAGVVEFVDVAAPEAREESKIVSAVGVRGGSPVQEGRDEAASTPLANK